MERDFPQKMKQNIFREEEWERIRHFLREYGKARNFSEEEQNDLESLTLVRESRVMMCAHSLELFMVVYLTHYLKRDFAPFHRKMCDEMRFDGFQFFLNICFREAAKTAMARGKALQWILFQKKRNIHWIGHEESKGRKNVVAIGNELIANQKILFDFGKILNEKVSKDAEKRQNTMGKFTTTTGVSMTAGTTQKPMRGDLEAANRPDAFFLDDIENDKTKASRTITQTVINYLGELFAGADASAHFVILANRISRIGTVNFLEEAAERMPEKFRKFEVKVMDDAGNPTWSAAWTRTEEEAKGWNETHSPNEWKRSIEGERMKLGEARFAQEYLNEPAGSGDMFHEENFNGFALSDAEKIKDRLEVGIIIDPSFSTRSSSDFCPIIALGRERWDSGISGIEGRPLVLSRFYVLDGSAEKYLPQKSIETAINMAFRWISRGYRVSFVSCELVSINKDQKDFFKNLKARMKERGLNIILRESRPTGQGKKEQRVTDVCQPILSTGRFFVRCDDASNGFWFELKDQFLKFPLHTHDDIPDVVAQGVHEFEKKGNSEEKANQSAVNEYFSGEAPKKWSLGDFEPTEKKVENLVRSVNAPMRAAQSVVDDYWNV